MQDVFKALAEGSAVLDCVLVLRNVECDWTAPQLARPAVASR